MHPITTEWDNPHARLVELGHATDAAALEADPAAVWAAVREGL